MNRGVLGPPVRQQEREKGRPEERVQIEISGTEVDIDVAGKRGLEVLVAVEAKIGAVQGIKELA